MNGIQLQQEQSLQELMYLEIDLISDNAYKNYFVVKKEEETKTTNNNLIILKVQKKTNKTIKELSVLQKVKDSNYVVNLYGYYKGVNKMLKPRLVDDASELMFIEIEDMGKYQTLDMIITRRKCWGLVMARFIMRGILASAYYFESKQIIHQTLQPKNIYILEDSLGTDDQAVVKFSNLEHCLLPSIDVNDRFVLGKDSVVHSIYSDRHQVRNLFKVVSSNTISFTIGIIYFELLLSTIYDDDSFKPDTDEYIIALRNIVRNGKLDIIINKTTNTKILVLNSNHHIEINDSWSQDINLISTLLKDQARPTIKEFIIDHLL